MKVLVDTCVWIAHFKAPNPLLSSLIQNQLVLVHEAVLGEMLVGNIPNRRTTLIDLIHLPRIQAATLAEAMWFVEQQGLNGKGLSWIDVHLLCATILGGARLYTTDVRLDAQAKVLNVAL